MPQKPKGGTASCLQRIPLGESEKDLEFVDEDVLAGTFRTRPDFKPLRRSPGDAAEAVPLRLDPNEAAMSLLKRAGFSLEKDMDMELNREVEDERGFPSLTLEMPESPPFSPPMMEETPLGEAEGQAAPRRRAGYSEFAAAVQALSAPVVEVARREAQAYDDERSVMSGDDTTAVVTAEPSEEEDEDTIYDGLASEFLGDERTERLRERREHQERIRHKERMRALRRGVKSYLQLQHFNESMWCETFGYDRKEERFRHFWAEEELRVKKAIAEWPLNPSRLPDLQRPEAMEVLVQRVLSRKRLEESGPEDEASIAVSEEGEPLESPKASLRGAMKVTKMLESQGVEYFYIDTQHRVMDFPHKAVAMEIWRQQTLVHVCSAFMQNDWKELPTDPVSAPVAGAFGRTVQPMGLRVGDAVVFPVQQRFSASFQDFIDGCFEEVD